MCLRVLLLDQLGLRHGLRQCLLGRLPERHLSLAECRVGSEGHCIRRAVELDVEGVDGLDLLRQGLGGHGCEAGLEGLGRCCCGVAEGGVCCHDLSLERIGHCIGSLLLDCSDADGLERGTVGAHGGSDCIGEDRGGAALCGSLGLLGLHLRLRLAIAQRQRDPQLRLLPIEPQHYRTLTDLLQHMTGIGRSRALDEAEALGTATVEGDVDTADARTHHATEATHKLANGLVELGQRRTIGHGQVLDVEGEDLLDRLDRDDDLVRQLIHLELTNDGGGLGLLLCSGELGVTLDGLGRLLPPLEEEEEDPVDPELHLAAAIDSTVVVIGEVEDASPRATVHTLLPLLLFGIPRAHRLPEPDPLVLGLGLIETLEVGDGACNAQFECLAMEVSNLGSEQAEDVEPVGLDRQAAATLEKGLRLFIGIDTQLIGSHAHLVGIEHVGSDRARDEPSSSLSATDVGEGDGGVLDRAGRRERGSEGIVVGLVDEGTREFLAGSVGSLEGGEEVLYGCLTAGLDSDIEGDVAGLVESRARSSVPTLLLREAGCDRELSHGSDCDCLLRRRESCKLCTSCAPPGLLLVANTEGFGTVHEFGCPPSTLRS